MKKKSSLVSLLIGMVALAIFLIPTKAAHADVTVTNDCTDFSSIQVSVSANSTGKGNTDYFNITPGQSDSWSRLSRLEPIIRQQVLLTLIKMVAFINETAQLKSHH